MHVFLWQSPLLNAIPGVRHGFTDRRGGVSGGAFASLNLGGGTEDDGANVAENRRRAITAIGAGKALWYSVRQMHADRVLRIGRGHDANGVAHEEADAIITSTAGIAIAALAADCVPLLIADRDGEAIACVHAGWRGTCCHVAARAVQAFGDIGIRPERLVAAIGPAIGPCCFIVGRDVAERLRQAFPATPQAVLEIDAERYRADLSTLNCAALRDAGVAASAINVRGACSVCTGTLFSHRRDAGRTGRQAGIIALAPRHGTAPCTAPSYFLTTSATA